MVATEVLPENEPQRIEAVRRYQILDTPPDGAFDRITALAARLFSVPIAIVTIVDTDRIWFKSRHGIDVEQIGRDPGLCASAVMAGHPWVIERADNDPRALANPLVAGEFGLRFYAGIPLTTHDGFNLGTLCVIDRKPRPFSSEDIQTLEDLAAVVMDEIELRLAARKAVSLEAASRQIAEDLVATFQESLLPTTLPKIDGFEFASRYHAALRDRVGGDFYDIIPQGEDFVAVIGDVCGKGAHAASLTGTARWTLRSAIHNDGPPSKMLYRLNEVLTEAADHRPERYITIALAQFARTESGATVTVALGGHPQPIAVSKTGVVRNLGRTAPIIGWLKDTEFEDETYSLESGEFVLFYTDGLSDPGTGGAINEEELATELSARAGQSAESIAEYLESLIEANSRDDTALVVVRVS